MEDDIYDLPELYDRAAPRYEPMERFYVAAAGGPGRRALDLACGTGRLTLPLARSGAAVTGGDLSEPMLARARAAASEAGLDIGFVTLDMRDFDLGERFDTVVVAANSLLHLHALADFEAFFAAVARHLAPGGRLVFDVFVPSAGLLSLAPGERRLMTQFEDERLGTVRIEETIAYDPVAQISEVEWFFSGPDRRDFRRSRLVLRQIYPQELPLLLAHCGFRLIERFGGFEGEVLSARSLRQVTVCAPI